jgi:glycosyltransferase involved in cell wall biosynthesis
MAGPPLTVAFDVTPLLGTRTGIGHATADTLAALTTMVGRRALIPYALGARTRLHRRSMPPGTRVLPVPVRALLWAWSRTDHPRVDRVFRPARVVHATNFVAPPTRLPLLVTVHDCTFVRFPETISPIVRRFGPILRRAVARGAWIHCTTETIADEVEDLLGPGLRRAGRIAVVPFAVPQLGAVSHVPPDIARRLQGRPYVIALGTLEPRKNLPRLVRAFGAVGERHRDLRLVIAGPEGPDVQAVEAAVAALEPGVRRRVLIAGAVASGDRRALIEGAAVLAYPSLYEGFGFPMLEAMTLGVPVLASRAGAIPEVADDAAHLVDPLDPDAIGGGLELLVTDELLRRELIERGRERAAAFTWGRTAAGLRSAYQELARTVATISS